MGETVAIAVLVLGCILAVGMTALRLPGIWLIVAAAIAYGWWTDWTSFGGILVAVLIGLGLLGEGAELFASVLTARKAGATRQAAWGGLAGGVLGMLFLSSLVSIPFPVIGTLIGAVIGAFIGCFAGAAAVELWMRRRVGQGARVGLFSVIGFALGTAVKLAIALAMTGIVLTSAVCSRPAPVSEATDTTALHAQSEPRGASPRTARDRRNFDRAQRSGSRRRTGRSRLP